MTLSSPSTTNLLDPRRSSRRASIAGSAYSAAGSTRHILADYNSSSALHLDVPRYNGLASSSPNSPTGLSLSVNYIPAKFSDKIINRKKGGAEPGMPKQGGGLAAFKTTEARIGGKTLKWTRFKWVLFVMNLLVSSAASCHDFR